MTTDKYRHLGLADERCPRCGSEIETLLNSENRNPMRLCWKCEAEDTELEEKRHRQQQEENE